MQKNKARNMKKSTTTQFPSSKQENVKDVFKKMLADKKSVQSYIRQHGTLNGFDDGTVIFAKPL